MKMIFLLLFITIIHRNKKKFELIIHCLTDVKPYKIFIVYEKKIIL